MLGRIPGFADIAERLGSSALEPLSFLETGLGVGGDEGGGGEEGLGALKDSAHIIGSEA